jgi:hypothetical protein
MDGSPAVTVPEVNVSKKRHNLKKTFKNNDQESDLFSNQAVKSPWILFKLMRCVTT